MTGWCCGLRRRSDNSGDNLSKVTNNSGEDQQESREKMAQGSKDACSVPGSGFEGMRRTGNDGQSTAAVKAGKGGSQSPVLIEHFTSQGCSSCPPADAVLSKLGRGQGNELGGPVLILAYHVDYWDYIGWKDPFASPKWTLRQKMYGEALEQNSIYTPEAVVQGRNHCVASKAGSVTSLVKSAHRHPSPDVNVSFTQPNASELKLSLAVSPRIKVEGYKLDVMVAIYENGLVTNCTRGENKGRMLTNDFVVSGLEKACTIENLSAKKSASGEVTFRLWDGFSPSKCGVVVFLQNPVSLEICGAQSIDIPSNI